FSDALEQADHNCLEVGDHLEARVRGPAPHGTDSTVHDHLRRGAGWANGRFEPARDPGAAVVAYPSTVVARILVIEDDDIIGVNLVRALSAEGWTAQRVASGDAALGAIDQDQFDLIVLDLGLPDVDGIELCGRLRARGPGATVVILSARAEEIEVV